MFYSKKCSISEHSLFFLQLDWLVPLLESSCPISNSPSVDQWARRQVLDNWPVVFGFGQVRWCMGELKCADMCNWVYPCCICLVLDMQLRICIIVQPRCRRTRETDNIQQRFHLFLLPISLFCYPVILFFFIPYYTYTYKLRYDFFSSYMLGFNKPFSWITQCIQVPLIKNCLSSRFQCSARCVHLSPDAMTLGGPHAFHMCVLVSKVHLHELWQV